MHLIPNTYSCFTFCKLESGGLRDCACWPVKTCWSVFAAKPLNGVATRTRTHSQPNVSSAIIAGLDRF